MHYFNPQGIMLIYDVTSASSFTDIRRWINTIDEVSNVNVIDICTWMGMPTRAHTHTHTHTYTHSCNTGATGFAGELNPEP